MYATARLTPVEAREVLVRLAGLDAPRDDGVFARAQHKIAQAALIARVRHQAVRQGERVHPADVQALLDRCQPGESVHGHHGSPRIVVSVDCPGCGTERMPMSAGAMCPACYYRPEVDEPNLPALPASDGRAQARAAAEGDAP